MTTDPLTADTPIGDWVAHPDGALLPSDGGWSVQ